MSERYDAEQCIKSLDKWIGEMSEEIKRECDRKKKDWP